MYHLIENILNNQIVTGLSATAIFGYVAYHLKETPSRIIQFVKKLCTVSISVHTSNPAFKWIELWLAQHPYSARARSVVLKSYDDNDDSGPAGHSDGSTWAFSPGMGFHWFVWNRRLMWIDRSSEPASKDRKRDETLTIYTLGSSQKVLRNIVTEAFDMIQRRNMVTVRLWRGWWSDVRGKNPRHLDTIILEAGCKERILDDIARFLSSREWYERRGIPWRRGYLFSGPPGTGKTSLVMAVAAYFKRQVCVLNLGSVRDDDALFSAIMDAPLNAIIVIEDIDCANSSAKRVEDGKDPSDDDHKGITKAGLLNALDGITTPDGRILIMTTNYPEKLDDALIRPGRADVHEHFKYLGPLEQTVMAGLYYDPGEFMPLSEAISPAVLQSAFMLFPDSPVEARNYLSDVAMQEAA